MYEPKKKNYSQVVLLSTTPLKKIFILFLSDTTRFITITPSEVLFLLPLFDFLFLFCCLVLGLLELDHLAFGVRWLFFLEGWFEFPHVYDSDFHLWVYRIYTHLVFNF